MIRAALYTDRKDYQILESEIREMTAYFTDEHLQILNLSFSDDYRRFIEECEVIDIICVDVTIGCGIKYAEQSRKLYPMSMIVIIADQKISPVTYMTPDIIATSLLLKPLQDFMVRQVMQAVFGCYILKEKAKKDFFVIDNRESKQRIPYSKILYFESKKKKIYACTAQCRYAFYGTLNQLEEEYGEHFIRCHRSFMVNRKKIEQIKLSENHLMLEREVKIPLSRSYKKSVKKYFYGK